MIDNYIDKKIGEFIIRENEEREKDHKSSGKLSASRLGDPLQWQVLYSLGVKSKDFDEYTLRKFYRGRNVEDWLLQFLDAKPKENDKQLFVEYRNVVGYVDAVCDTSNWENPCGVIPVEIKSVSNAKFKRILSENKPDKSHELQAGLYSLAMGTEKYAICYVATDDYRVRTFIGSPDKKRIDEIIDRYDEAIKGGVIPVFVPMEKWQEKKDYNKYPEWAKLSQEEVNKKYNEVNIINNKGVNNDN